MIKLTFEKLWADIPVGTTVQVTDGKPAPFNNLPAFNIWRSTNYEGNVVSKSVDEAGVRTVYIQLPATDVGQITYGLAETLGDKVTLILKSTLPNPAVLDSLFADQIDQKVGSIRQQFITSIAGQELTYLQKEQEAKAFSQDPDPSPSNYPLIWEEAQESNMSPQDVANDVLTTSAAWRHINKRLEGKRMGLKRRIKAANTQAQKRNIADFNWNNFVAGVLSEMGG